jgi:NADH-quinone oxidoreductase subunit H
VFLALPFSSVQPADGGEAISWVALPLNIAAFFILAVAGLEVFGVILGGYSSGSKWSLYGAMREAAQVVSYEIPLALCVVIVVLISGTMDLAAIGNRQAGWLWNWHLLHDPFTFVTFWVYATCAVASTNRAPFDLPEAESELVAGFLTEYSGFRWVIFFMAEYAAMFVVSALGATLFLGGWNGPVPVCEWLGLTPEHGALGDWLNAAGNWVTAHLGMTSRLDFAVWFGNLLGTCNFITKAVLGVTCMIWLRWTLPRLRIDQVMTTCLKYCVPIASAMLAGAMLWCYLLPNGLLAELWRGSPPRAASELDADCKLKIANCKLQTYRPRLESQIDNLQFSICNLQSPPPVRPTRREQTR